MTDEAECGYCEGDGWTTQHEQAVACSRCNGTGFACYQWPRECPHEDDIGCFNASKGVRLRDE